MVDVDLIADVIINSFLIIVCGAICFTILTLLYRSLTRPSHDIEYKAKDKRSKFKILKGGKDKP